MVQFAWVVPGAACEWAENTRPPCTDALAALDPVVTRLKDQDSLKDLSDAIKWLQSLKLHLPQQTVNHQKIKQQDI